MIYILLSEQSGGSKVKNTQNLIEKKSPFWKNGKNGHHFQIGGHFEFENAKFGFLDLKNPRKVLLHKITGSGK